jgi:hypothetical protein
MNFVENEEMELLTALLTDLKVGTYMFNGKVEAFCSSLNDVKEEPEEPETIFSSQSYLKTGLNLIADSANESNKDTLKVRRRSYSLGNAPPRKTQRRRASSLGDISEPSTQALMLKLIQMLNESSPDHDFGNVKLTQFIPQDMSSVSRIVENYLSDISTAHPQLVDNLWRCIDNTVNLTHCEVFQYRPDPYNDDLTFTAVWSFHYFFYNHDLKQLVYFTCNATR